MTRDYEFAEKFEKLFVSCDERYQYIHTQGKSISSLVRKGLLPSRVYGDLSSRNVGGIIKCFKKITVLVWHEWNDEFDSWYFEFAKKVDCKIVCFTNGVKTFWFHCNGQRIKKEDGTDFEVVFDYKKFSDFSPQQLLEWEDIFSRIENVSEDAVLKQRKHLNPKTLSERIWQKIWIVTGKEPIKCLYNFVEVFIFKFLSDVGVLRGTSSFNYVHQIFKEQGASAALEHYALKVRKEIHSMLPASDKDKTQVINGTIFVSEDGEPNFSHANLFSEILKELHNYTAEYGSFRHIDKKFKTRLYESFLKKSAGVSQMGQFFTPRTVVTSMVQMIDPKDLKEDMKICDPFCGVGGFLMEFLNEFTDFYRQFEPRNGVIAPKVEILGIDKGSNEKEDERTIVLAKANMLIYFSNFLAKYRDFLSEFTKKVLNKTFLLQKSNLGTFEIKDYKDYFDLILTNPPYVTNGISIIKKEIKSYGLDSLYPSMGQGLEVLAIDWIIRALKPRGKAFVVVPDGILSRSGDEKLRKRILKDCILDAVISLPEKTFFSTPKKTYILAFTKREEKDSGKNEKVFTFLVDAIGETKDVNRFEEKENDLVDMSRLFKEFMLDKENFKTDDHRCKIHSISRFEESNWLVDRDWEIKEEQEISEDEFKDILKSINSGINAFFEQDNSSIND